MVVWREIDADSEKSSHMNISRSWRSHWPANNNDVVGGEYMKPCPDTAGEIYIPL